MLIIFFDIKGIVHKEFVLAGQTVYLTFYGNWVKLCKDFVLNFGGKNWLLHHDNTPSHTSFS
jgi:hypothetical protein